MPFATGTADTAVELQTIINTLVTANSWTKLRGETDMACASPKAARYWRMLWFEEESTGGDFRQIRAMEWRTAVSGADIATTDTSYSASSGPASGSFQNIIDDSGTPFQTPDIDDQLFWIKYDFGSATIIRELLFRCSNDARAPRNFVIQWSNDDVTWTTMFHQSVNLAWVDDETKIFTFDDAFLEGRHFSSTICRRRGNPLTVLQNASVLDKDQEDGTFVWQGPGYDANRRVFIGMRSFFDISVGTEWLQIKGFTDYDTNLLDWDLNENADTGESQFLLLSSSGFTYWIYVNSIRIIIVIRNGLDDYTSAYAGFTAAFALPADWAQPLAIMATADTRSNITSTEAYLSSFCDPGEFGQARWLDWNNVWSTITNRNGTATLLYEATPLNWVFPWHVGINGDGTWPRTTVGDNDTFNTHWLDKMQPTEQGDLPIIPATIWNRTYGAMGVLDGVYAVPGGGIVTVEQVITIAAQDYRVFASREDRDGQNFFLIRED